jgi:AbrB family looped-hinge helix DNA binding protein
MILASKSKENDVAGRTRTHNVPYRVTSKGQVTIPLAIREQLGIVPGSEVEFYLLDNEVRLRKVKPEPGQGRGWALVERMRGRGTSGMTTDEIMALTRGDD